MIKNSKLFLLLFLGTLSAFGPFVIDLYLPALPTMSTYFNVSTTLVQLTLTGGMVGLAIGQIIIGPLSDKFGRKNPLIISLFIYLLSTLVIMFTNNIYIMIFFRFLQGTAAAGSLVMARAVTTDIYSGEEMRKFFGLLMVINGIAPIVSPIIGGLLLDLFNWRAIFLWLAIIGLILLAACFKFYESLHIDKREVKSLFFSYFNMIEVLKNKKFLLLAMIQMFSMGALFVYIAASPFIFQIYYKSSVIMYSIFFALNGIAIVIGNYLAIKVEEEKALKIGIFTMLFMSIILFILLVTGANMYIVELSFFLLLVGFGYILTSAVTLAMKTEKEKAGSASALIGFFPYFFGGLVSPLVGIGNFMYSSAVSILACSVISYMLYSINKKNP